MLLFFRKSLVLINQLHDLWLRTRPLALDISQCVKDCQIEIDCRHPECFPVSACRHLILYGITRIDLREASYSAEPDIHVILDLPEVLRDIQKLLHIFAGYRLLIVLVDGLAYLIWRHLLSPHMNDIKAWKAAISRYLNPFRKSVGFRNEFDW
jgi:hypothetical protein